MNTTRRTKGLIGPLALALAFAGAPVLAVASTSTAAATTCATTTAHWGSLPKSLLSPTSTPITNVRAGRNTCFDRMVVDLLGRGAGYVVRYAPVVLTQGQGAVIPLRGGAKLDIVVRAGTYDNSNNVNSFHPANTRELVNVTGFSTFRQVAFGGSFEGYTTFGLGVRARLPMRAFILNGPGTGSRVVIDVAHHW